MAFTGLMACVQEPACCTSTTNGLQSFLNVRPPSFFGLRRSDCVVEKHGAYT